MADKKVVVQLNTSTKIDIGSLVNRADMMGLVNIRDVITREIHRRKTAASRAAQGKS